MNRSHSADTLPAETTKKPNVEEQQQAAIRNVIRESQTKKRSKDKKKWMVVFSAAFIVAGVAVLVLLTQLSSHLLPSEVVTNESTIPDKTTISSESELLGLKFALNTFLEKQTLSAMLSLTYRVLNVTEKIDAFLPKENENKRSIEEAKESYGGQELALLHHAASVIYEALESVLLGTPRQWMAQLGQAGGGERPSDPLFPSAVSSIPESVFQWVVVSAFALNYVIPEYLVRLEPSETQEEEAREAALHATVLLQSINLASWFTHSMWEGEKDLLARSGLCQTFKDAPAGFQQFCASYYDSEIIIDRIMAINYEELIAVYPQYGPFRLHYASRLFHTAQQYREGKNVTPNGLQWLLNVTERDIEKPEHYPMKDEKHAAVARWLRVFAGEVDESLAPEYVSVLEAVGTCRALQHPSEAVAKGFWHRMWPMLPVPPRVMRPPLLTTKQIRAAVGRFSSVLPSELTKEFFSSCDPMKEEESAERK